MVEPSLGISPFDLAAVLLLFVAAFGLMNERWIGLPQPISLLIGALAVSLLILVIDPLVAGPDVTAMARGMLAAANLQHVLLDGALAFLLFASSLHVDLGALRANKWTILALATGGVILSTLAFGVMIWGAFRLTPAPVPLKWCFTLAAILAPTDAVAVDAMLRRVELPDALRAAIAGESLFNDGVGVVIFQVALASAMGATGLIGHGAIAAALVSQGVGGFAIGLATGFLAARAMRMVETLNLELTISLALVLGTYRLATGLGVSGAISVVASGLVIGNFSSWTAPRLRERLSVVAFWSLIDELLNAILFLLIGFEMLALDPGQILLVPILASIPFAILARAGSVGIPLLLIQLHGHHRARSVGVLTWTGLRGGVSVALALALPNSPYRSELLSVCYAVVVFTIIVQGLSMPVVLRLILPAKPPAT